MEQEQGEKAHLFKETEYQQQNRKDFFMIKFILQGDTGKKVIGLGLSEENVARLKKDKPILVKGQDLGVEHDIVVLYGETEESIVETLKELEKSGGAHESKD